MYLKSRNNNMHNSTLIDKRSNNDHGDSKFNRVNQVHIHNGFLKYISRKERMNNIKGEPISIKSW